MSVLTITNENFEQEILKSDKPVIVDFGQLGADHARCSHLL